MRPSGQQTPPAAPPSGGGAAAAVETDKQAAFKKEFIKSHAGLTSVPVKVLVMGDLEVLDLSHNAIEIVPLGVFSDIPKLKTCDLSHNSIKSLPNDIAVLKDLETLMLQHNCLAALPAGLYSLSGLSTLDLSFNCLLALQQRIANMQGLQVLNLSGNRLRALPSDLGWLSLKQLSITDNPDLQVPTHVLQKGLRAVMSYLQVVGEQHHQVDAHMSAFSSKLTELRAKHNLLVPGTFEDEEAAMLRLKLAQRLGVLSYSGCNLGALPALIADADAALADVQVVDVSMNKLHKCPTELLGCINKLLVFNMAYNSLHSWPEGLFMPALVVLNLSFNKLQQLPADMGQQLPSLQQLYLANNALTSLPDSLSQLELRDLFVSENSLQAVPEVLSECTALVKLSLAACQLSGLCRQLAGMSQLRFLDLSFNQLTALSTELGSLDGLRTLNLGYNALGAFPAVVSCMTCLRELNLDSTGISMFPRGLGELRQLEGLQADGCPLAEPYASLYAKDPLLLVALHDSDQLSVDLTSCGLEAVPLDLLQQTQLTSLNLSKNNIQDLPPALGNLRRLRQLGLKGNPLRQPFARLADTSDELAVLALLRPGGASGALDLCAYGFESLPSLTWELPGRESALLELHLTDNRLRTLPQELSRLTALSRLVIDSNSLRELPRVVLQLPSLTVLQASHNSITHLPEDLGQMAALQALMLSGNQLHHLPASISCLPKLRALSVASNRLWQMPQSLCDCSCLKLLDCSHNLLGRLPQGMSALVCLRSLKLTHNRLVWLPVDDLRPIKVLEELHVAGNGFGVPGIECLNATGQPQVQSLLAAVALSGHSVPPPMHALSQGRMSPLDASLNASRACGDAAEGLAAATAGPTPYASEAGHNASGLRSASPSQRSLEAQNPSSSGFLGVIKRIGSRSALSFAAREQQPSTYGSSHSDSSTAAPSGSGAASTASQAAGTAASASGDGRDGRAAGHASGNSSSSSGSAGTGDGSTGAQAVSQPSNTAGKVAAAGSVSAGEDVAAAGKPADASGVCPAAAAEPAVASKHRPSVHFAAEDTEQQQAGCSGGQQAMQQDGLTQQDLLQAQQAACADLHAAADHAGTSSSRHGHHSHNHVRFSSESDPAATAAGTSLLTAADAVPESPDPAGSATAASAAAGMVEQPSSAAGPSAKCTSAASSGGADAAAASGPSKLDGTSGKPDEPQLSNVGKEAAKPAAATTASKTKEAAAAAAAGSNNSKAADSTAQAAAAGGGLGRSSTPGAAPASNGGKAAHSEGQAPASGAGTSKRASPGPAAGQPAAKAAALTGGKQSGQQGLAAQHAATPAAPGLGVTAAVGSDAAALAPAAETATAQAAASPGQHLQQHVPPAEQQSAANKQQQQQNRQQTEPSSSSGSTCTHQQRPAAVVASKPQDPVKTATGQTGAGPAAPQPAAPAPIKTAAIPVAADKSACVLRTSSNLPPAFLVLLQESDAALGQHPLDKVAIMDIPRVVRSCFAAPSPPSGSAGAPGQLLASGQPARPQTKARFKRVLVQSAHALSLLEYGMQQLSSHQAGAAL